MKANLGRSNASSAPSAPLLCQHHGFWEPVDVHREVESPFSSVSVIRCSHAVNQLGEILSVLLATPFKLQLMKSFSEVALQSDQFSSFSSQH